MELIRASDKQLTRDLPVGSTTVCLMLSPPVTSGLHLRQYIQCKVTLHVCFVPDLQARQALGVGPDAFLPSNLDAQATTLKELDVFAPNLRDMLKATQAFADHTNSKHTLSDI
jgi:hypothetical protein